MDDLLPEAIGWVSSVVLLFTLMAQVLRQWRAPSVEGVSWILFSGQIAASLGFMTYSLLIQNTVFIVTNSLILATALTGQMIYLRKRRRQRREESEAVIAGK
jgi:MtN3 and saliva related transmembrane protein